MWIKTGALGGTGIRFSNLPVWVMAGLGITMAFYSSLKLVDYCNKKRGVLISRGKNDDGINRLPDDVLCNIVSRLIGIEASRTSILSRRWRKIWTMNPEIRFVCSCRLQTSKHFDDYSNRQSFFKAVNQCLKLYSGRNLKVFAIYCCFLDGHACLLEQWMQTVARLGVERIILGDLCELRMPNPKAFTFSFKLINGASRLRKLTLISCNVETSFIGQYNYSLVSLKLESIQLRRQELSDILLSACPNLRSLSMYSCILPLNLRISGPNLKLETLTLSNCVQVQKLDISALNLVTINIHFCTKVQVLLSSVQKLAKLYLDTPEMHCCFEDVPWDLPKLNCLLVQARYQILWLPPTFTVFGNVRILYLLTRGYHDGEVHPKVEVDLWNFAPALAACPLLKEFYLSASGSFTEEKRKWPAVRHKHLKHVELAGFSNTQNQLEFAKFILTSAQGLHLLLLRTSHRMFGGELFYFPAWTARDVIKQIDDHAEVVCANLAGHALSMRARVEMCAHGPSWERRG